MYRIRYFKRDNLGDTTTYFKDEETVYTAYVITNDKGIIFIVQHKKSMNTYPGCVEITPEEFLYELLNSEILQE